MSLTFDYDKFDKKGLEKVSKQFDKESLPVAEVKGDNKPKRENGFQVKTALITFESGQKLEVKAKADGGIFQWKLNSKILAIKNYMQLDQAMKEVVSYVKENEPNYQKQREKQLAKVKIAVPTIKPVNSTVAEQTAAFQTSIDELAGQNEALNSQIADASTQADGKQSDLDALTIQIADANALTLQLETKLGNAKQGIFESAGDGSDCCPECGATMQECEGGMECPECDCKVDAEGMVMEGSTLDGGMMCDACQVKMEPCNDGYKCPECGQISAADGTLMESIDVKGGE
jgi:hypothetical protein